MKLTIRKGMFETNSSSMHSIIITDDTHNLMYLKEAEEHIYEGIIEFWGSSLEFNRSPFNILADVYHKTAYAIASFCGDYKAKREDREDFINNLTEMFKNCFDSFDHFVFDTDDDYYPFGYVDHQSKHLLKEFLENEQVSLADFIFSPQYIVIIDSDETCVWDKVKQVFKSNIKKEVC